MAAPHRCWAAHLLRYWFHRCKPRDWWVGSPAVTSYLERNFERYLLALQNRQPHEFLDDPQTALAAVLLFDQVPRNLYAGTAGAFAFDPLARQLTYAIMRRGWDARLSPVERQFAALPLMHSEDIADQRAALAYFTGLGPNFGLDFARSHYQMIARFGRYPHRNEALGRRSTPAEIQAVEEGFAW